MKDEHKNDDEDNDKNEDEVLDQDEDKNKDVNEEEAINVTCDEIDVSMGTYINAYCGIYRYMPVPRRQAPYHGGRVILSGGKCRRMWIAHFWNFAKAEFTVSCRIQTDAFIIF